MSHHRRNGGVDHPYRETGSGGPGTVTSGADYGALVDVAGGDEALGYLVSIMGSRRGCGGSAVVYLVST